MEPDRTEFAGNRRRPIAPEDQTYSFCLSDVQVLVRGLQPLVTKTIHELEDVKYLSEIKGETERHVAEIRKNRQSAARLTKATVESLGHAMDHIGYMGMGVHLRKLYKCLERLEKEVSPKALDHFDQFLEQIKSIFDWSALQGSKVKKNIKRKEHQFHIGKELGSHIWTCDSFSRDKRGVNGITVTYFDRNGAETSLNVNVRGSHVNGSYDVYDPWTDRQDIDGLDLASPWPGIKQAWNRPRESFELSPEGIAQVLRDASVGFPQLSDSFKAIGSKCIGDLPPNRLPPGLSGH